MPSSNNNVSLFKNPASIYIIFWVLYRLQALWYHAGGVLTLMILIGLLLVSLYHSIMIYSSHSSRPFYFRGLGLMLIMYTIYGIVLFITDGAVTQGLRVRPPTYIYLKNYYISLLPIISFYYYTKKGYLNGDLLRKWVPLFIILGLIEYFHWQQMIAAEMRDFGLDETNVNNMGYTMVSIIPCLFVLKKSWLQYLFAAICVLFAFFSMKRGAIICGFISATLLVFMNMKSRKGTNIITPIILISLVTIIVVQILENTLFQNDFYQARMQSTMEGNVSGRDELYASMFTYYKEGTTIIQKLIGLGADGTLKISMNYAHNDWLEILIDQGILGIAFFIFYWRSYIKSLRKNSYSQQSRNVLIVILLYTFLQTLYSMTMGGNIIYMSCIFGYALADGFSRDNEVLLKQ